MSDPGALWGKTRREGEKGDPIHALVYHMLDVAAVAEALWDAFGPARRSALVRLTSLSPASCRRLLAYLCSLHDLGKASPAFQLLHEPAVAVLRNAGLSLPLQGSERCYHGVVTAHTLAEHLVRSYETPPQTARILAHALGGHHGTWPTPLELNRLTTWQVGGSDWEHLRGEIVALLFQTLQVTWPERWPTSRADDQVLATLVAGLTSQADWIGSMNDFFPYSATLTDPTAYLSRARVAAKEALTTLCISDLARDTEEPTFERLFPGYTPNPLQRAMITLFPELEPPFLVIIEAPTGCGKTEAALLLAEHSRIHHGGQGAYVAMPTMATSNQMHQRVREALAQSAPDLPEPLLVHSQALWRNRPPLISAPEDLAKSDTIEDMAWFIPRKRSLLAPFGVGTVDQALLSVLQTRHFFVRLHALAHKVIVFDEVHAYDTYQSQLLERLLVWLQATGASVIILSATLPRATRQRLWDAYKPHDLISPAGVEPSYPCITYRSPRSAGSLALQWENKQRVVSLARIDYEVNTIVEDLRKRLVHGGCAAVICNTVARAQEVYLALREAHLVPADDLTLFHARYPAAWRDEIEQNVLTRYGKTVRRDGRHSSIVVATQVIEQSLDLDLDYMITDLAPIDLLIQRAGRLHRHGRAAEERARPVAEPILSIAIPPLDEEGVPSFGSDGYVYEPYILLRTFLALQGRHSLTTPFDTPDLIAAVYDDQTAVSGGILADALAETKAAMEQREHEEIYEAIQRLVPAPWEPSYMSHSSQALREDDPRLHSALQALTRLSPPSVQMVCLHDVSGALFTDPCGGDRVDLTAPPSDELARTLARYVVSVSHRGLVPYLRQLESPAAWKRHPYLRVCVPVVFVDGVCSLPNAPWALTLTRHLGLQIGKEER